MEINVDHEAHEYVMSCVNAVNSEIGGIAYIELVEPGSFYISEFVLLEQEVSASHVDFEGEAYIEEIMRAANEGKENQLRCSWHSHGNMGVYFSSTDEQGIKEYSTLGIPWLVSLVFNKSGEIDARVDIFDHEICEQITMSDVSYFVDRDFAINERAIEDVKRLVKKPKTVANSSYKPNSVSPKIISQNDYHSSKWDLVDGEVEEEGDEMPDYLEKSDFLDPYSFAIMEMQYGANNVARWERMLFPNRQGRLHDDIDENDLEGFEIIT